MNSARCGHLVYAAGEPSRALTLFLTLCHSYFLGVSIGKHIDPVPVGYEELKTHPHERLPSTLEEVSPRRNRNYILKTSQGDSWPNLPLFLHPTEGWRLQQSKRIWLLPGVTTLGLREQTGLPPFPVSGPLLLSCRKDGGHNNLVSVIKAG